MLGGSTTKQSLITNTGVFDVNNISKRARQFTKNKYPGSEDAKNLSILQGELLLTTRKDENSPNPHAKDSVFSSVNGVSHDGFLNEHKLAKKYAFSGTVGVSFDVPSILEEKKAAQDITVYKNGSVSMIYTGEEPIGLGNHALWRLPPLHNTRDVNKIPQYPNKPKEKIVPIMEPFKIEKIRNIENELVKLMIKPTSEGGVSDLMYNMDGLDLDKKYSDEQIAAYHYAKSILMTGLRGLEVLVGEGIIDFNDKELNKLLPKNKDVISDKSINSDDRNILKLAELLGLVGDDKHVEFTTEVLKTISFGALPKNVNEQDDENAWYKPLHDFENIEKLLDEKIENIMQEIEVKENKKIEIDEIREDTKALKDEQVRLNVFQLSNDEKKRRKNYKKSVKVSANDSHFVDSTLLKMTYKNVWGSSLTGSKGGSHGNAMPSHIDVIVGVKGVSI